MTNGDRIRSMPDDDLAGWVLEKITECEVCPAYHGCDYAKSCKGAISKWLKEEAEGNE